MTAVFGLLAFNVLRNLGASPITDWDESRHAVSAYEMLQRGDWIGNTWRGQLDYWNLKPPLSMWAEMLSFQMFGYTPFAFRLPAAVATMFTVAAVAYFSYRFAGRAAAVVSALALTTSSQFILTHNARTGDPDALFLLGSTVALLAVIAAPRHPRLLLLASSAISFAFLAKSFHVTLLAVFAVAYLLVTRRAGRVRLRNCLIALLGFVPLAVWVAVRFAYDGMSFLGSMFLVDVLRRTEAPAEGNSAELQYYTKLLFTEYWMWLLVLTVALVVWLVARRRAALGVDRPSLVVLVALGVWAVAVIGVFSLMATKLAWYTLPAYPALATMTGIAVALALRQVRLPLRLALTASVAGALVLAQAPITFFVSNPGFSEAQSVFLSLDRTPATLGRNVYLDPALGWSQGLVAAAELGGGLRPADGGIQAAVRDGDSLVLLQRSSLDAAGFRQVESNATRSTSNLVLVPARVLLDGSAGR